MERVPYGRSVKPTTIVGTAKVPGSDTEMCCYHHDGDYRIFVDRTELMSTRVTTSEEALAELAFEARGDGPVKRVLIGGLGMGFTLARALALAGDATRVDVIELVPEVVDWNRDLFGERAGHPLRDRRAHVVVGDVGKTLRAATGAYDIVLLDVDNGPEGLARSQNSKLYTHTGLRTARRALRPGGVLALWSSSDVSGFMGRVQSCGFEAKTHGVRSRGTKGAWRTIWIATAV